MPRTTGDAEIELLIAALRATTTVTPAAQTIPSSRADDSAVAPISATEQSSQRNRHLFMGPEYAGSVEERWARSLRHEPFPVKDTTDERIRAYSPVIANTHPLATSLSSPPRPRRESSRLLLSPRYPKKFPVVHRAERTAPDTWIPARLTTATNANESFGVGSEVISALLEHGQRRQRHEALSSSFAKLSPERRQPEALRSGTSLTYAGSERSNSAALWPEAAQNAAAVPSDDSALYENIERLQRRLEEVTRIKQQLEVVGSPSSTTHESESGEEAPSPLHRALSPARLRAYQMQILEALEEDELGWRRLLYSSEQLQWEHILSRARNERDETRSLREEPVHDAPSRGAERSRYSVVSMFMIELEAEERDTIGDEEALFRDQLQDLQRRARLRVAENSLQTAALYEAQRAAMEAERARIAHERHQLQRLREGLRHTTDSTEPPLVVSISRRMFNQSRHLAEHALAVDEGAHRDLVLDQEAVEWETLRLHQARDAANAARLTQARIAAEEQWEAEREYLDAQSKLLEEQRRRGAKRPPPVSSTEELRDDKGDRFHKLNQTLVRTVDVDAAHDDRVRLPHTETAITSTPHTETANSRDFILDNKVDARRASQLTAVAISPHVATPRGSRDTASSPELIVRLEDDTDDKALQREVDVMGSRDHRVAERMLLFSDSELYRRGTIADAQEEQWERILRDETEQRRVLETRASSDATAAHVTSTAVELSTRTRTAATGVAPADEFKTGLLWIHSDERDGRLLILRQAELSREQLVIRFASTLARMLRPMLRAGAPVKPKPAAAESSPAVPPACHQAASAVVSRAQLADASVETVAAPRDAGAATTSSQQTTPAAAEPSTEQQFFDLIADASAAAVRLRTSLKEFGRRLAREDEEGKIAADEDHHDAAQQWGASPGLKFMDPQSVNTALLWLTIREGHDTAQSLRQCLVFCANVAASVAAAMRSCGQDLAPDHHRTATVSPSLEDVPWARFTELLEAMRLDVRNMSAKLRQQRRTVGHLLNDSTAKGVLRPKTHEQSFHTLMEGTVSKLEAEYRSCLSRMRFSEMCLAVLVELYHAAGQGGSSLLPPDDVLTPLLLDVIYHHMRREGHDDDKNAMQPSITHAERATLREVLHSIAENRRTPSASDSVVSPNAISELPLLLVGLPSVDDRRAILPVDQACYDALARLYFDHSKINELQMSASTTEPLLLLEQGSAAGKHHILFSVCRQQRLRLDPHHKATSELLHELRRANRFIAASTSGDRDPLALTLRPAASSRRPFHYSSLTQPSSQPAQADLTGDLLPALRGAFTETVEFAALSAAAGMQLLTAEISLRGAAELVRGMAQAPETPEGELDALLTQLRENEMVLSRRQKVLDVLSRELEDLRRIVSAVPLQLPTALVLRSSGSTRVMRQRLLRATIHEHTLLSVDLVAHIINSNHRLHSAAQSVGAVASEDEELLRILELDDPSAVNHFLRDHPDMAEKLQRRAVRGPEKAAIDRDLSVLVTAHERILVALQTLNSGLTAEAHGNGEDELASADDNSHSSVLPHKAAIAVSSHLGQRPDPVAATIDQLRGQGLIVYFDAEDKGSAASASLSPSNVATSHRRRRAATAFAGLAADCGANAFYSRLCVMRLSTDGLHLQLFHAPAGATQPTLSFELRDVAGLSEPYPAAVGIRGAMGVTVRFRHRNPAAFVFVSVVSLESWLAALKRLTTTLVEANAVAAPSNAVPVA